MSASREDPLLAYASHIYSHVYDGRLIVFYITWCLCLTFCTRQQIVVINAYSWVFDSKLRLLEWTSFAKGF